MDRKEAEEEGLTHSENPQIYGNMSKHTEKTNNYMTGSSDKPCEADRWIYTLIKRLPGKISKKLHKGGYEIEPLVPNIPWTDKTKIEKFIAFACYVDVEDTDLKEGDHVTFSWDKPGERRAPRKDGTPSDPKAIEVKRETPEKAEELAKQIKDEIATELRRQLEEKLTKLQQREDEIKELKDSLDKRNNEIAYKLNYLQPYAIEIPI